MDVTIKAPRADRLDRLAALADRCRLPWLPEKLRTQAGRLRTQALRDACETVLSSGGGTVWLTSGRYDVRGGL